MKPSKPTEPKPICANCRYFFAFNDAYGTCKFDPRHVVKPMREWCGQHKPRK